MGSSPTLAANFLVDLVVWLFIIALAPEALAVAAAIFRLLFCGLASLSEGRARGRRRRRLPPRASWFLAKAMKRAREGLQARRRPKGRAQDAEY